MTDADLPWKKPIGPGPTLQRILLLLIAGAAVIHVFLHPVMYWNFVKFGVRHGSVMTDETLYTPRVTVKGGKATPLPVAGAGLDPAAAKAATALADEMGESALLVWYKGALQLRHFSPGVDPARRTNGDGMTRSVVALLAGGALEEGYIASIYDPTRRYLKEYSSDVEGKVLIEHLLAQTSGMEKYPVRPWPTALGTQMHYDDALLPAIFLHHLDATPGTRFRENDVDAQILLLLVERAAQLPFADYLSERIWAPGGFSDAAYWLDREGGLAHGFDGFFATADDWMRLGLLVLNDGAANGRQLIGKGFVDNMRQPNPQSPNDGWQLKLGTVFAGPTETQSAPFLVHDLVYFEGEGGQRVYVSKTLGLVVVRTGDAVGDYDEAKLINMVIKGLRDQPDGVLPQFTGKWSPVG